MEVALEHWRNGDRVQGLEELQRCHEQTPDNVAVLNNMVAMKCNVHDLNSVEEALDALESVEVHDASEVEGHDEDGMKERLMRDAVASYNRAVLKMRQGRTDEGMVLLKALFEQVHVLEDGVALGVCFLLMDGFLQKDEPLACKQPAIFLEQTIFHDADDSLHKIALDWDPCAPQDSNSDGSEMEEAPEMQAFETRTLCFPLVSRLNSKTADDEIGVNGANTHKDDCPENLAVVFALYRARIMISLGDLSAAKEQLKAILQRAPSCISALLLQAQIAFKRQELEQASTWMQRCIEAAADDAHLKGTLLNNMGAIQYRLGNWNLATLCFSQALQKDTVSSMDDRLQSLYNLGLVSLQQGRYEEALSKLRTASTTLFLEPCLWIRMAECCIALRKASMPEPALEVKRETLQGPGLPAMMVLPMDAHRTSQEQAQTEEWLGDAHSYLLNALALMGSGSSENAANTGVEERQMLKQLVCVKLAFVSLALDRPERCLHYVQRLKETPVVDLDSLFYATMYEVEALCLLGRPQEAVQTMRPFVETFDELSFTSKGRDALDLQSAQKMMYQNLASVHCANRDFAQAKFCIQKALLIDPACRKSLILHVYVELATGNKKGAIDLLRGRTI